ncbi:MAG: DVU0298 family protein [Elusimicrobiota bacterium]
MTASLGRKDLDDLIMQGTAEELRGALLDSKMRGKLRRRIVSLLNSPDPDTKWRAALAMGIAAAEGVLPAAKVEQHVQRFLWAMNDESGAVPFGVPEALGELLAARPEFQRRILPILVSYLVSEEIYQTGSILAGAIWALGRVGLESEDGRKRALPGLRAALGSAAPEVRGAALWTLKRLGLGAEVGPEILPLREDKAVIRLLVDGEIMSCELGQLAREAVG